MSYTCDVLVVTCIDARFQKIFDHWLQTSYGYGHYDRVGFIGGVKSWGAISSQIVLAKALHNIKKVVLVNHEDCAVYRGAAATHHHSDLRRARDAVLAEFPDLQVELYYAKLDGRLERVG